MKLDTEFVKLPLRFDAERLAGEVAAFTEADWKPHPQGNPGNSALSLIAVGGDPASDAIAGPMLPTPFLDRGPYLRQVLATLQTVLGRTRLMRIAGEAEAVLHVDSNYYWIERTRVHVPIVTFPDVEFLCGDASVHMAPGECWIFDTWRLHNVLNPQPRSRIHLVADTVGSAEFWDLVAAGKRPRADRSEGQAGARFVPFDPDAAIELETENVNVPVVMSPWEQQRLIALLLEEVAASRPDRQKAIGELSATLRRFQSQWRALWARYGDGPSGWPAYRRVLDEFATKVKGLRNQLRFSNKMDAVEAILQGVVRPALHPELAEERSTKGQRARPALSPGARGAGSPRSDRSPAARVDGKSRPEPAPSGASELERPIFIVAAPRSGSTLLFETLAHSPDLWTIGGESHLLFERIEKLNPVRRGYDSNRLTAGDADEQTKAAVRSSFLSQLRNREGQPPSAGHGAARLLEKTPKNALRIPFLSEVFPDALFIYLFREPPENLSSIIEAWRSGRFVTYPRLPDWTGPPWSLLLIPGWRELRGKPLAKVAAEQYVSAHEHVLDDLSRLPAERWTTVGYAQLLADPQGQAERLCRFAGVGWDQSLRPGELPLSRFTLSPPNPEKWRRNEAEIRPVLPRVEPVAERVRALVTDRAEAPPATQPARPIPAIAAQATEAKSDQQTVTSATAGASSEQTMNDQPANADAPLANVPLRSVHTNNMPKLLDQLGISLLVTTYQAGKLILVRVKDGTLNAHFRSFAMPMGLAGDRRRLALGTKLHVWEFRNQPEVARKLEPVGKHDACFLPRSTHVTGDIRIHEIAFAGPELWIVNTRFSCLCTLDRENSFVPRWRPSFVSGLAPEDRCHLNGLAMVDGRPKYVTCLGETDHEAGWRDNKARGGCLVDVDTGEILLRELSMPHSPRWHNGQLLLLESGDGSVARVDLDAKRLVPIAQLPGFTRGVDFYQNLAFIGLSKVRESAIFSGIPITERLEDRTCGVWVVDLNSGKTVGFLRFESGVEEIFAVQVLHGVRMPDLISDDEGLLANSFMLPQEALADVPAGVGK